MEFFRCDWALNRTVKYYNIGLIYTHMQILAGKEPNGRTNEEMYELMFTSYQNMEAEIINVIHECKDDTRVLFFENLKEWLNYNLISHTRVDVLEYEVDKYNREQSEKLEADIEEKVKIMKDNPAYKKYGINEEYEATRTKLKYLGGSLLNVKPISETYIETNRKFYCIEEKLDVLDWGYFDLYVEKVDRLLGAVRNILSKYVRLYDEGKIILNTHKVIEIKALENTPHQQLLDTPIQGTKKIKTTLNVEQIAYLFKMLLDENIIEPMPYKELHEFISNNFTVKTKEDGEAVSVGKLARVWSKFDSKTVGYWMDKFIELRNKASKENPNNIKPKR